MTRKATPRRKRPNHWLKFTGFFRPLRAEALEERTLLTITPHLGVEIIQAPGPIAEAGDVAYFAVNDGAKGDEVWKTDTATADPASGSALPRSDSMYGVSLFGAGFLTPPSENVISGQLAAAQLACSLEVTTTTDGGPGSLRQAITCANSNGLDDVIIVPAGQYTLTGIANEDANAGGDLDLTEANHSLTIRGAGADQTIIDAAGIDRGVHVLKNVIAVLEGLSITGGSATSGGGVSNAGQLTLNDATVRNNTAATGGGISNTGQLTLNRTSVQDNTATSTSSSSPYGGGIYASVSSAPSPFVAIVDSTIEGNGVSVSVTQTSSPGARGGGIASLSVPVTVTNSTIRENSVAVSVTTATSSSAHGGGIYVTGSTLGITNSEVRNNSANNSAGGTGSALSDGGGIYVTSGSLTIGSQSSIVENAIVNSSATTGLINALGGGVFYSTSTGNDTLSISDTAISRNTVQATKNSSGGAVADGGGIRAIGGTIAVSRTTFDANTVTAAGGALGGGLDIGGSGTTATNITMTAVVVSANTVSGPAAPLGGGVYAGTNTTANFSQTTIRDNRLTGSGSGGGGIYFSGNQLTIDASTVSGNAINSPTSGSGGGIRTAAPLTLINSTVSGNTVTGAAGSTSTSGGISTLNKTVLIRNSTITGNRVIHGTTGGLDAALVGGGAPSVTIHNTIVAGNFAGSDGTTPSDIVGSINVGTAQSPTSFNNLVGDSATRGGLTNGVNGNKVGNNGSGTIDINTVLNTTLTDNGGPTKTHALVVGGPAIDTGSNAQALDSQNQPLATDQRGSGFLRIVNNTVDIGAFEAVPCLTVVNTNDTGPGSLREAILCANNTPNIDRTGDGVVDPDPITFSIPGSGVHTISPASALPTITDPVIIDGYTQSGAKPNSSAIGWNGTLSIELDGLNAGDANGLRFDARDSTVRGLIIGRFNGRVAGGAGVWLTAQNVTVEGNFIGISADGLSPKGNTTGVLVLGPDKIGGASPAARNVVSGNEIGVYVDQATNAVIQGNIIGPDATGTAKLLPESNQEGIYLRASRNTVIGGVAPGAGNVISGNGAGVFTFTQGQDGCVGLVIQGNKIGTDATGTVALGNSAFGIILFSASQVTIGGVAENSGNVVAFNGEGIYVSSFSQAVAILGNSIFNNRSPIENQPQLGIDLADEGATPNDLTPTPDADTGANNLQNFPEITYATKSGGMLKVTYTVPSDPDNSTYPLRVEFFQADADGQEGQTFLGFDTFNADDFAAGPKTVTFATAALVKVFDRIVATATDSLAGGGPANTSEFSPSIAIASPWRNLRNPVDVNDDTHVVAGDALDVINYINAFGSTPVPDNAENVPLFYDTNGDNNVSPADSLEVINFINAFGASEGESAAGAAGGRALPVVGHGSPDPAPPCYSDLIALLAFDNAEQSTRRRR